MQQISGVFDYILNNIYLRFLFILLVTLLVALLARFILKQVLRPLTRKTKTKIDDLLVRSFSSMIFYLVFAVGFKVGFAHFKFETAIFNNLIQSLVVVVFALLIIRIINGFSKLWQEEWASKTASTADDRLIPLFEKILKTVVIILAVIFVFDSWNVDISPLLATAGIAGIAISFAVKDSLANMLGGLQLVLDKTFKVGDKIEIESGELGVVLDIGLRSTKLKTYDNEVISIPNGYLSNAKVKNFTMPDLSIRVNVNFGVEYGSDPDKVRQVVLAAVTKEEIVLQEPEPMIQFVSMGAYSLDFIARVWVKNYGDAYNAKLIVTDVIYKALNQAGIGIPFPTHTIIAKK